MGTCINKRTVAETDLFNCCTANPTESSKLEILCGKEQIDYYLNNKITDLTVDFTKRTITDTSNSLGIKEIKVPEGYFKLLESYSRMYNSTPESGAEMPSSHLSDRLPIPTEFDPESFETLTSQRQLGFENSLHPVLSKPLSEVDTRNPNLIFNDLMQEAFLTKNEKLENLIKTFLLNNSSNNKNNSSYNNTFNYNSTKNSTYNSTNITSNFSYSHNSDGYQNLIESLIKLYTHENGLNFNINAALREQRRSTFLGSTIILLYDAIKTNYANLRFESKCYRKANLTQEEFDSYFAIFNKSGGKSFCWNSFVSVTKTLHLDSRNSNINSSIYDNLDFNTVFTIEFSSDSWGLDISQLSLSKADDEILLAPNSVFEIVNLYRDEKDQIIHIGLVKLDKNATAGRSRAAVFKSTSVSKPGKIIEKEFLLLQNDLEENSYKYCFAREEDNISKFKFALNGPPQTAYAGGVFQVNIFVPEGYPNKAPLIKFATKIYHPNISLESGELDNEIVEKVWRPSLSIAKFINIIYNMLIEPFNNFTNNDDLNSAQKKLYLEERERFDFNALEATRRFANFKGIISDMQRKEDLSEFEARTELLRRNAFETIV